MSRKLSAATIRAFRDEWHARVTSRRAALSSRQAAPVRITAAAVLDAVAVHEIRRLAHHLGHGDWKEVLKLTDSIHLYADGFGLEARGAALEVLHDLVGRTRMRMPANVAHAIARVASDLLPLRYGRQPGRRRLAKLETRLIETAIEVGFGLAYDGALYSHDLGVVDAGGDLLQTVLRIARINNLGSVRKRTQEGFEGARDAASRGGFVDAGRWLTFLEEEALAESAGMVMFPSDLAEKLSLSSSSAAAHAEDGDGSGPKPSARSTAAARSARAPRRR